MTRPDVSQKRVAILTMPWSDAAIGLLGDLGLDPDDAVQCSELTDRPRVPELCKCCGTCGYVAEAVAWRPRFEAILRAAIEALGREMRERPYADLVLYDRHGKHRSVALAELLGMHLWAHGVEYDIMHCARVMNVRGPHSCQCGRGERGMGSCPAIKHELIHRHGLAARTADERCQWLAGRQLDKWKQVIWWTADLAHSLFVEHGVVAPDCAPRELTHFNAQA